MDLREIVEAVRGVHSDTTTMPDYRVMAVTSSGSVEVWHTDMKRSDWEGGYRWSAKRVSSDFPIPTRGIHSRAVVMCACEELSWLLSRVLQNLCRTNTRVVWQKDALDLSTSFIIGGKTKPVRLPVMLTSEGVPTCHSDSKAKLEPRNHCYVVCTTYSGRRVHIDLSSSQYLGVDENYIGTEPPSFMDTSTLYPCSVEYGYMTIPDNSPEIAVDRLFGSASAAVI